MAAGISEAEVLQMEMAVIGFPLHITSIEAGVSMEHFFRQWAGECTVEPSGAADEGESGLPPRFTGKFKPYRALRGSLMRMRKT